MIAGLCESPLTFQAIIIWRDELNDGKVFLRDIIDLEATYAGPDAKNNMATPADVGRPGIGLGGSRRRRPAARADGGSGAAPLVPRSRRAAGGGRRPSPRRQAADERRELRRRRDAAGRGRLRRRRHGGFAVARRDRGRAQAQGGRDLRQRSPTASSGCAGCRTRTSQLRLKSDALSPAQERKYKKLKEEIIAEVKSLRLNQARIDALVEQLYDINKRLVGYEGRLMRLSESYGVAREDFLKNYQGSELDPRWLNRVSKLSRQRLEEPRRQGQGPGQGDPRPRSTSSPARPGSRSANSARSCRWCRRASARPARPRRRWSRQTCASSSRSPRNTPTAACSSST